MSYMSAHLILDLIILIILGEKHNCIPLTNYGLIITYYLKGWTLNYEDLSVSFQVVNKLNNEGMNVCN
jgi:hypothetical protein